MIATFRRPPGWDVAALVMLLLAAALIVALLGWQS